MKTWNETKMVLQEAARLLETGRSCVLVVLTQVQGSAFRRAGAKLLIRDDGTMTGNVSGGCLENDLRERASVCLREGVPQDVTYKTGSDEEMIWGLGLGCDGTMDLRLLPLPADREHPWIHRVLERMEQHKPITLHWPKSPAGTTEPVQLNQEGEGFVDRLEPPPDVFIVGAGDDAIPLAQLAGLAGFRVTVIDHRSGYLTPERFPDIHALKKLRPEQAGEELHPDARAFALIKNHALEMDKQWAAFFDQSPVAYIGILGPKKRNAEVKSRMMRGPVERIFGPAGLDIGGEGAEQIALSIVAEMLAVWARRAPDHLRHRQGPIH